MLSSLQTCSRGLQDFRPFSAMRCCLYVTALTRGAKDSVRPSRCILSGLWFLSRWLRAAGTTDDAESTVAWAAASGFQLSERDSCSEAVGSVLHLRTSQRVSRGVSLWQLGWWLHGSSPVECLGVTPAWMILLATSASRISLKVNLIYWQQKASCQRERALTIELSVRLVLVWMLPVC